MSAMIMEAQLLGLLRTDPDLAQRGCTAEAMKTGGIAVLRAGHHRGMWAWAINHFAFTPGGYSAANFEVETAVEALLHTRNVVCPSR